MHVKKKTMLILIHLLIYYLVYTFINIIIIILINAGKGNCFPSQVGVQQYKIRDVSIGISEFLVNVTNPVTCMQTDIVLACNDFNSIEFPDTSVIDWDGEHIYVKKNIYDHGSVSFKYSWGHQETITPLSSKQCC